ncbi:MAG TPA: hypothetical protein VGO51_03565 [Burkholderiaceae bacterium]|nr:hypothetical protein [Burkholderiaceae bacterium]
MLESKKNRKQDEVTPPSIPSSSPGDSPVAVTPKDVSPEHAAWKDLTARPIASDDVEKRTDALLDEASDLSFPASDPIAVSSITKLVKGTDADQEKADKDRSKNN